MSDFDRIIGDNLKSASRVYEPSNEFEARRFLLQRVRRNRFVHSFAVVVASVALAVGIVAVQRGLLDRTAIEDPAPKPPAGEDMVEPRSLLFVYSADGDIWGQTEQGRVAIVHSEEREVNPTLSPNGHSLVFERGEEHDAVLVWRELSSSEELVSRDGHWPAFAPDGKLAWLEASRSAPKLVIGPIFGKVQFEYDLRDFGIIAAQALTWSEDGKTVYFDGLSASRPGWGVYQMPLGPDAQPFRLEPDEMSGGQGANFFSPAGADQGGVDVIRVCCGENPEFRDRIEIGHVSFTEGGPEYSTIAALDPRHIGPGTQEYSFAPAGALIADAQRGDVPAAWATGVGHSWFVSDGSGLYLVNVLADGRVAPEPITDFEDHLGESDYQGIDASASVEDSGSPQAKENEPFALLPEVASSEVRPRTEGDEWRDDPVETAKRFVEEVIGWTEFDSSLRTGGYGRTFVSVRSSESNPPGRLSVDVEQVIGDGRWSVMGVGDPTTRDLWGLGVGVNDRRVKVGFGRKKAASVLVRVDYAGQPAVESEVGALKSSVTMKLESRPTEPGYLLLLFKDQQGVVFRAHGFVIVPGDWAAG